MSEKVFNGPLLKLLEENSKLAFQIGTLTSELKQEKKYHLLLGARGRIEMLEELFQAKKYLSGNKSNRKDTWSAIMLHSKNRMVNDIRNKISQCGLTDERFCEAIGVIYGDFSDPVAHSVPLPPEIQDEDIKDLASLLNVIDYEPIVKALNIVLRGLQLVNAEDVIAQKSLHQTP